MYTSAILWTVVCLAVCAAGQPALKKPEIYSLHVYSDIKYRFATTLVTSRVKNVDETSQEALFDVTLPNEAFITNFTLEIDGKIVVGEIKEKAVAKEQYETARARGNSAGYVGTKHRETNKFNLAVTVAPMSKVSFNLTYQELLKRKTGHYEQVVYIDPGQVVPDMDVTVSILESRKITMLKVPPLRNDVGEDLVELNSLAVIDQPTPTEAFIKYIPSMAHQKAQSSNGIAGQFVVKYDVERHMDAGEILVVNGYFVHFFAPSGLQPIPNDVLFILDTSGSMTGRKLDQLKDAMLRIVREMNEGDRFNIMTFSRTTSLWKSVMVDLTDEDEKEEARRYIRELTARGFTNINAALLAGIDFLSELPVGTGRRSPIIVFLTDGKATSGVKNTDEILRHVKVANEGGIPIFSLAFGENADYDLVKRVAIQNNGFGRKIYEASDAAMQIAGFYSEISVTLLSNITFQYLDAPVADLTRRHYANYFQGSEMVVSGRIDDRMYHSEGRPRSLTLEVSSNRLEGPRVLVLSAPLEDSLMQDARNLTALGDYETITEKVWAYLTIKQLLQKELATSVPEQKKSYTAKILQLALKYGFVTPLTSMVVTEVDEEDEERTVVVDETDDAGAPQDVSTGSAYFPPPGFHSSSDPFAPLHVYPNSMARSRGMTRLQYDAGISYSDFSAPRTVLAKRYKSSRPKSSLRRRNKKHRKRRNRNKRKRNKTYLAPALQIQYEQVDLPICFNLYSPTLAMKDRRYVLYRNEMKNITVEVGLSDRSKGRLKQAGIRDLTVIDPDVRVAVSSNRSTWTNHSSAHWSLQVVLNGSKAVGLRLRVGDMNIYIAPLGRNYISLLVDNFDSASLTERDGILGNIHSSTLKVMKIKSIPAKRKRPARKVALLTTRSSRGITAKQRLLTGGSITNKKGACWGTMKKERQIFTMEQDSI